MTNSATKQYCPFCGASITVKNPFNLSNAVATHVKAKCQMATREQRQRYSRG